MNFKITAVFFFLNAILLSFYGCQGTEQPDERSLQEPPKIEQPQKPKKKLIIPQLPITDKEPILPITEQKQPKQPVYMPITPIDMPTPLVVEELAKDMRIYGKGERLKLFLKGINLHKNLNKLVPAHKKNNKTLRIATYNVHFWTDALGSAGSGPGDVEGILKTIEDINPDILLLQEANWGKNTAGNPWLSKKVQNMTFDELKQRFEKLGYIVSNAAFCKAAGYQNAPFGNLILSKYPLVNNYSLGQRYFQTILNEKRCIARANILLPNGKPLLLVNTHLEEQDSNIRQAQAQETISYINEKNRIQENNVIIAGDMNATRKNEFNYQINGNNAWDIFQQGQREISNKFVMVAGTLDAFTNNKFTDHFSRIGSSLPKYTVWNGSTIDFVFVKNTFEIKQLGAYVWYSSTSDHLPLIADFEF